MVMEQLAALERTITETTKLFQLAQPASLPVVSSVETQRTANVSPTLASSITPGTANESLTSDAGSARITSFVIEAERRKDEVLPATSSMAPPTMAPPKPKSTMAPPSVGLPKPKSATLKRRKSFDPALHDPFLANALGGGMSAADNQIRKFMNEGGFEGLDGAGKPLKERNMGPFVSREEAVLNDMVKYLSKERDGLNAEDKQTFRQSAVRSEVAEKLRNRK